MFSLHTESLNNIPFVEVRFFILYLETIGQVFGEVGTWTGGVSGQRSGYWLVIRLKISLLKEHEKFL